MASTVAKRTCYHRFAASIERAPIFTVLCLLLATTVIAAAAISGRQSFAVAARDWASRLQAVGSDRRGFIFVFSDVPFAPECRLTADATAVPAGQFKLIRNWLFESGSLRWRRLGFWYAGGTFAFSSSRTCRFAALMVPYWILIVVPLVPPAFVLRRAITRWQRKRRGKCPACGYDLRDSPGRCPECGAGGGQEGGPETTTEAGLWPKLFLIAILVFGSVSIALTFAAGGATRTSAPQTTVPLATTVSIRLDHVSRRSAVEAIAQAARIRINVAWPTFWYGYLAEPQSVALHNASGTQVLDAIRLLMPGAHIHAVNGTASEITCEPPSDPCVHVYSVGDLLRQTGELMMEDMSGVQRKPTYPVSELDTLISHDWFEGDLPVTVIGSRLFFVGSDCRDENVRTLLQSLRVPSPPLSSDDHEEVVASWPKDSPSEIDRKIREGLSDADRSVVVNWQSVVMCNTQNFDFATTRTRHGLTYFSADADAWSLVGSVRLYDVDDLIAHAAGFRGSWRSRILEGRVNGVRAAKAEDHAAPLRNQGSEILLSALETLINTDQWKDNGGAVGATYFIGPKLAIRTTTETHRSIDQLFSRIRSVSAGAYDHTSVTVHSAIHTSPEPIEIGIYDARPLIDAAVRYRIRRPKPVPTQPMVSNAMFQNAKHLVSFVPEIDDAVDALTTLIERKIDTDTWRDNGGSVGSILEMGGILLIGQTPATQQKVNQMLDELRHPQKLEAALEAQDR